MPGKTIRNKTMSVKPAMDTEAQVRRLESELDAVCAIGSALATSVGLDALFARIVPQVTKLMRAGRTTLYLYDEKTNEVWSKVAEGEERREIRLSLGEGVAGWVAQHRKPVKVEEAYKDPIFNPRIDIETGFQTKNILAVPLLSRAGRLLGVLEVLNKISDSFSDDDVALVDTIAVQVAYAVENAHLEQQIIDQNKKLDMARQRADSRLAELDLLYQLEQEASACANLDELLDSIILRACNRLRSDAGAVLLSDVRTGRLYFRGISGTRKNDLRMVTLEPGEGVVGWVAKTGEPLVINHPENDSRCNVRLAQKVSYPVHAILAVPLIWDQKTIGAVEVLNPMPRDTGERGL